MKTYTRLVMARGVTLIELMIVVGLLAIIGSIAIPAYNNYVKTGEATECRNEVAIIQLALEENFLDSSQYFLGADILAIRDNSNGLYTHTFDSDAAATASNCTYAVTAGSTGSINTSYTLTADANASGPLAGAPSPLLQKGN